MLRRVLSSSTPVGSYPEPTASECVPTLTPSPSRTSIYFSIPSVPNGTRFIIIVQPNSAPTGHPLDFTSNYTATGLYSTSTDLVGGSGSARVVWDGNTTATSLAIGGLSANTPYYFRLYSFKANTNNDYSTRNYNTVNFLATAARTTR